MFKILINLTVEKMYDYFFRIRFILSILKYKNRSDGKKTKFMNQSYYTHIIQPH